MANAASSVGRFPRFPRLPRRQRVIGFKGKFVGVAERTDRLLLPPRGGLAYDLPRVSVRRGATGCRRGGLTRGGVGATVRSRKGVRGGQDGSHRGVADCRSVGRSARPAASATRRSGSQRFPGGGA